MIIFLVEKVNVNCNTYKNGWIYLLVIITIICYLNFTEPPVCIIHLYHKERMFSAKFRAKKERVSFCS